MLPKIIFVLLLTRLIEKPTKGMNFIKILIEFITDKTSHWTTKAMTIVGIILILFFMNDYMGFTYHFKTNWTIQDIRSVNELLLDSSLSTADRNRLAEMRHQILERRSLLQKVTGYFQKKPHDKSYQNQTIIKLQAEIDSLKQANRGITDLSNHFDSYRFSPFLMFLSSSLWWLILDVILIISLFFAEKIKFLEWIVASLIITVLLVGVSFLFTNLLKLIPLIGGNPWWNYVLNFLIHTSFIAGSIWISVVSTKRKKIVTQPTNFSATSPELQSLLDKFKTK